MYTRDQQSDDTLRVIPSADHPGFLSVRWFVHEYSAQLPPMLDAFAGRLSVNKRVEANDVVDAIRRLTPEEFQTLCETIQTCGRTYFGTMNSTELIDFLGEVHVS